MDLVALVREHLAEAHPDVLRSLIETFVEALMGAEVDAICGAAYHQPRAHTSAHTASQPSYTRRGLAPPERKDPKASRGELLPRLDPSAPCPSQGSPRQV